MTKIERMAKQIEAYEQAFGTITEIITNAEAANGRWDYPYAVGGIMATVVVTKKKVKEIISPQEAQKEKWQEETNEQS
jgi:hypothetical protein